MPDATIYNLDQLRSMVEYYLTQPAFVFDVETVGEFRGDPRRNRVLWIGFATTGRADVLPLGHPNGEFIRHEFPLTAAGEKRVAAGKEPLPSSYSKDVKKATAVWTPPPKQLRFSPAVQEILRPLFFHPEIIKVCHNSQFDLGSIAKHFGGDIPTGPYFDTQTASFLLDQRVKGHNTLGDNALREVGYEMTKGVGKQVEIHPFDAVEKYTFLDAKYTWLVYLELRRRLEEQGLENLMRLEMDLLGALLRMNAAGSVIDVEALTTLDASLVQQLTVLEANVYKAVGCAFPLGSNPEKIKVLFGAKEDGGQGLRPRKLTGTGGPSVDQAALEAYAGKNDVVDALLAHSEVAKLRSTYTLPYLGGVTTRTTGGKTKEVAVESLIVNGKIHTTFNPIGADTGRFTSKYPNLQNVPRPSTPNGKAIRGLFIGGDGMKLVVADYSQIEPRVLTDFSEDPTMLHAYLTGQDIYTTLADPLGLTRSAGKVLVLSQAYGIGDDKMAADLGVSKTRVKEIKADFNKHFPNLERYKQQVIRECKQSKPVRVETILGRRRYLPELFAGEKWERARAERQAFNTKIQGSAADIIKLAMVRLDRALLGVPDTSMTLTIHDEIVTRTPAEHADLVAEKVRVAMEGITLLKKVPLVADLKIVDKWAEAK
jgi:DNA polymerase I-like protein with 3'-5' exonuclease and polymerase domains